MTLKQYNKEYKRLLIALQSNIVNTLFYNKFKVYKYNKNSTYENKQYKYDEILNQNLNETLNNNKPNKGNAFVLIIANARKAVLSKEVKYVHNAIILIKIYELYFVVDYLKNDILKCESDQNLHKAYIDLVNCLYIYMLLKHINI